MPILKITLFFEQRTFGWTESYLKSVTDTNLRSFATLARNLANRRVELSGQETYVRYARLSMEGVYRDVLILPFNGVLYPEIKGVSDQSDNAATSVMVRYFDATSGHTTIKYLRGIWETVVTIGGQFTPPGNWVANFRTYRTYCINQQLGWMGPGLATFGPVLGVDQILGGTVGVTLQNGFFAPGTEGQVVKLSISGVQGATQINGSQRYRIASLAPAVVARTINRVSIFPWNANTGNARYVGHVFYPFADIQAIRVNTRRAGRPSYQSPGRRRARSRA